MSKYNKIGSMRLKFSGRVNKEKLIEQFEIVLSSITKDYDLESFSGVNIYFQTYNKNGEKLALVSSDGVLAQGLDVSSIPKDFSLKGIGCSLITASEIERQVENHRIEQERRDEIYRKEYRDRLAKEQAEKEKLNLLRNMICDEFSVVRFSEVGSSVGRITTVKAILKYITESDIPESGFVYRVSLRNQNTRKVDTVRIYDSELNLIKTISLESIPIMKIPF